MHGSHITACLLALAAVVGCGDDAPKSTISDNTSWQVYCSQTGGRCQRSLGAHRDREDEDIKIEVSCSKRENGLAITLNDPGSETPSVNRPPSTLEITRLDPERNRCTVSIDETTSAGRFQLTGQCGDDNGSACRVEGKLDSNGWAFDGTLECAGLNTRNAGTLGDFGLAGALITSQEAAPMVLQIANCK